LLDLAEKEDQLKSFRNDHIKQLVQHAEAKHKKLEDLIEESSDSENIEEDPAKYGWKRQEAIREKKDIKAEKPHDRAHSAQVRKTSDSFEPSPRSEEGSL